jgi:hypothetical protein
LSTTKTETKKESKPEAIQFNFNEKSVGEFTKEGLDPPYDVRFEIESTVKFKAKAKPPLQIIIKTMNRRQIITYDENGKPVKKEFLTYRADYHAKDWLGNDLWIRSHLHGQFKKPKFRVTTTLDPETGEHVPKKEYDGTVDEYYIELTDKNRKQVIEEIINNSNGTIIDEILFYGHFLQSAKGIAFRSNTFTYDQFINSSFEELENLGRTTPSPARHLAKDKKSYMG